MNVAHLLPAQWGEPMAPNGKGPAGRTMDPIPGAVCPVGHVLSRLLLTAAFCDLHARQSDAHFGLGTFIRLL
jgi:hypothetical protein